MSDYPVCLQVSEKQKDFYFAKIFYFACRAIAVAGRSLPATVLRLPFSDRLNSQRMCC